MNQAQLEQRIKDTIDKYSDCGKVTDIWLSTHMMAVLDPRMPLERLADSYKLDQVWVSAFSELNDYEFRLAFKAPFEEHVE